MRSSNRRQKGQSWRAHTSQCPDPLQSYSNQSGVLAVGQTHRSMGQTEESRNKLSQLWSTNCLHRCHDNEGERMGIFNKQCWDHWISTGMTPRELQARGSTGTRVSPWPLGAFCPPRISDSGVPLPSFPGTS